LVEDDALEARSIELAKVIASRPPVALRLLKQAALAAEDTPLGVGLMLERRAFELLFDTTDKREGMAAFAERRPARFTGC
jgi:enoyl-CoA hydratase/carnithine racemase